MCACTIVYNIADISSSLMVFLMSSFHCVFLLDIITLQGKDIFKPDIACLFSLVKQGYHHLGEYCKNTAFNTHQWLSDSYQKLCLFLLVSVLYLALFIESILFCYATNSLPVLSSLLKCMQLLFFSDGFMPNFIVLSVPSQAFIDAIKDTFLYYWCLIFVVFLC